MTDNVNNSVFKKPIILHNFLIKSAIPLKTAMKQINRKTISLEDINKENDPNVTNSRKRRLTTSSIIFGEEPVFSDSDEELEYSRILLESHKNRFTNSFEKTADGSSQEKAETVNSDKLKMTNIVQLGTSMDSANGTTNEQILENKEYRNEASISAYEPRTIQTSCACDGNFLPSRTGNTGWNVGYVVSEESFDSGISNLNSTGSVDNTETKEIPPLRRCNRVSKVRNSGVVLITSKKRYNKSLNENKTKNKNEIKGGKPTVSKNKSNKKLVKKDAPTKTTHKRSKLSAVIGTETIFVRGTVLPKTQIRALARNWMKPNKRKSAIRQQNHPPLKQIRTIRHLFSPSKWMQSEEFKNLWTKSEKRRTI